MSELKAYKADVTIPVYGTIADAEVYLKDKADEAIAELKDKCQMHDFFWEGCGFARRGFKNTIAVSEAFDRLEAKNIELQSFYDLHGNVDNYIDKLKAENTELKQKLESVQASMYADVVDANMDNRKLRRALWIARARRAIEKIAWFKLWNSSISTMNPEDGARQEFDKWKRNLGKFLKKEEEYK